MCHESCLAFGQTMLFGLDLRGKYVLDVGALNINGSLRPHVEELSPLEYVGIDIVPGPGVDREMRAENLLAEFGPDLFALVICTEMLEHVEDWRAVIHNIKDVCAPGGTIILTTRSTGFPLHEHPADFWRFEDYHMHVIFGDCEDVIVCRDTQAPGVFVRARKPHGFAGRDLTNCPALAIVPTAPSP